MHSGNIYIYHIDVSNIDIEQYNNKKYLNEKKKKKIAKIKNKLKKKQSFLARVLLHNVIQQYFPIIKLSSYSIDEYKTLRYKDIEQVFSISISHSFNRVAVAICLDKISLGLDIEHHKKRQFDDLLNLFANKNEQDNYQKIKEKTASFYQLWTAKEALYKASHLNFEQACNADLTSLMDLNVKSLKLKITEQAFLIRNLTAPANYSLTLCHQQTINETHKVEISCPLESGIRLR